MLSGFLFRSLWNITTARAVSSYDLLFFRIPQARLQVPQQEASFEFGVLALVSLQSIMGGSHYIEESIIWPLPFRFKLGLVFQIQGLGCQVSVTDGIHIGS